MKRFIGVYAREYLTKEIEADSEEDAFKKLAHLERENLMDYPTRNVICQIVEIKEDKMLFKASKELYLHDLMRIVYEICDMLPKEKRCQMTQRYRAMCESASDEEIFRMLKDYITFEPEDFPERWAKWGK